MKLDIREYANIESDALSGKFDAFILSRATVLDSGDPAAYLYSDFASDGTFNIAQLGDKDVDKALRKAARHQGGRRPPQGGHRGRGRRARRRTRRCRCSTSG